MKQIPFFLLVLAMAIGLGLPSVSAATIQGSVYDLDLQLVKEAIIEISTTPHQRFVAIDGTYQFEVPPGEYTVTVRFDNDKLELMSKDKVTVKQDGTYVFDIFLFPSLADEEEFFEEVNLQVGEPILPSSSVSIIISIALLIVFLLALLLFLKLVWRKGIFRKEESAQERPEQPSPVLPDSFSESLSPQTQHPQQTTVPLDVQQPDEVYGKQILDLLQKNQGRMTQKEVRKELPLSEAKVSLLITELEHAAKIKKIKKGRGNILVLQ